MKSTIVFTGGGTAGHVTPNLALIEVLRNEGWQIDYIGSKNSVEQEIIQKINIAFHSISSGKLRRYFSWKNFFDPFKILFGIIQAFCLLRKLQADIVFSKGGFVAFPVVVAAWLNRIPVIAHESDITPGLANRLSFPFVDKICLTFDAAKNAFKNQSLVEITGTPIRPELFTGNKEKGLDLCGFQPDKPCLLVMGGSLGANKLNQIIRDMLETLNEAYQVIHLCGKGKLDKSLINHPEYAQFEYANEELPHLFAASDVIISRAGANALYEILALQKAHILIPLSAKVSRGDQIQNAKYFQKQGISTVIADEALSIDSLTSALEQISLHQEEIRLKIQSLNVQSATSRIIAIIKEHLHVQSPKAV